MWCLVKMFGLNLEPENIAEALAAQSQRHTQTYTCYSHSGFVREACYLSVIA